MPGTHLLFFGTIRRELCEVRQRRQRSLRPATPVSPPPSMLLGRQVYGVWIFMARFLPLLEALVRSTLLFFRPSHPRSSRLPLARWRTWHPAPDGTLRFN